MKANKVRKRLAKIEAMISDLTERYSKGAFHIREALQNANPVAKALLQLRFPGAKVFGGFGAARLFPEPLGFDLGLRQDTLLFRPFLRGRHCGSVYHRRRLDCDNDQSSEYELRIGDYRELAT
jgi:hypothetical protein